MAIKIDIRKKAVNKNDAKKPLLQRPFVTDKLTFETHVNGVYITCAPTSCLTYATTQCIYLESSQLSEVLGKPSV